MSCQHLIRIDCMGVKLPQESLAKGIDVIYENETTRKDSLCSEGV